MTMNGEEQDGRPKTVDQVASRIRARGQTPAEAAEDPDLEDARDPGDTSAADAEAAEDDALEQDENGAWPEWVSIPVGMQFPDGKQVFVMRFRAAWTDRPKLGDRQCLMWNLTEADEKLALKRTRGETMRTWDELAKQMIRVVDGKKVNWASPMMTEFWNDIGGACRQQVKSFYTRRHSLSDKDKTDFFTECVVARTVAT